MTKSIELPRPRKMPAILRPPAGSEWRVPRSLGTTLLRELAIKPEVAAAQALREVCGHDRRHWDGIAAYCRPENKVSLGFVEGLNNKIRVFQRRAYGLKNEEYFRLKVLTCMLPEL